MSDNFYEPPGTIPEKEESLEPELYMATTGKRFLNFILDRIVIYILLLISGILNGISQRLFGINMAGFTTSLGSYLSNLVIICMYYIIMEHYTGRTLAKYITKTRVVDENGMTPQSGQIVKRTLLRFVPFEALSFLGGEGFPIGWHDRWSGTRVIADKKTIV